MTTLFSLSSSHLAKLDSILTGAVGKNILELYTDIVNGLQIADDKAIDLVEAYRYVLFLTHERDVPITELLAEVRAALDGSKSAGAKEAAENVQENSAAFADFFAANKGHSLAAKKRYLASRLFNSVIDIHSVCDLRPILDEQRTRVVEWLTTTYLELTVTDSLGTTEVIPLNLDGVALQKLRQELTSIEGKIKLIEAQGASSGGKQIAGR